MFSSNNSYLFSGDLSFICIDIFLVNLIMILVIWIVTMYKKFLGSLYVQLIVTDYAILINTLLLLSHLFLLYYIVKYNINVIVFNCIKIDGLSTFFKVLIDISMLSIFILSKKYYFFERIIFFEYVILFLLSMEGSFLMLVAHNLFFFYLALEIQNLTYYILAASKRYSSFSIEASLKYFLVGALSSGLFLYSLSSIYIVYGDLNFISLYYLLLNNELKNFDFFLGLSFFFLLVSLFIKLGVAPFHWWLIDVYVGAPTVITLFFSIIPKIVYIFVLIKFSFYFFVHEQVFFGYMFFVCGLLSIVFGFVNAMFQINLKKFLAYSAIYNVGYMLIGIGTFDIYVIANVIVYMISYMISVLSIFFCIIMYNRSDGKEFKTVFDLSLYSKYSNVLGFLVVINFFAFIGIPPMSSFWAKLLIMISLSENSYFLLLVLLLLSNIMSVFYYIRIVRYIYFSDVNLFVSFYEFKYLGVFISLSLLNIFSIFFFDMVLRFTILLLLTF